MKCFAFVSYSVLLIKSIPVFGISCSQLIGWNNLPLTTHQVIIVNGASNIANRASVMTCEKISNSWVSVLPIFDAAVGKNGIAYFNQKVEGDGKTPSGIFQIGEIFGLLGSKNSIVKNLKLDYHYITSIRDQNGIYMDKFVDDPYNYNYNRWVSGNTSAKSFEVMKVPVYELGVIIKYNIDPVILGKGSAIFIHKKPEASSNYYTLGCIALDKLNLIKIVQWLDKAKNPLIMIFPL